MITVQNYDKDRHLPLLKEWTKDWDMLDYPWDYLSRGWVAVDDDPVLLRQTPLAMLMMSTCDGQKAAMIDYLISAPEKEAHTRNMIQTGIGMVWRQAEEWLKENDIKLVLAHTQEPRVVAIAQYFGFSATPVTKLWRLVK